MSAKTPTSFHVKSFGCQMNVYDGDRMAELLSAEGMAVAADAASADLVVLNTCHIREKAVDKVYSDIGRLRRDDGSRPMIAVAGCVAQAQGAEISRRAPSVDVVIGPQAYHRLPALVRAAKRHDVRGGAAVDLDMPAASKFGALPARAAGQRPSAFLTVQEGCDKFCTFCVVPYTRGAEISRPFADLVAEAAELVAGGAREIILLGQNVNGWRGQDGPDGRACGLEALIHALADLPGLARIRYTTSHPTDMTDALIAAHRDVPQLMPYLHLPVQSGSDRMLQAMNRSHSAASYLAIIDRVRAARPDIAISGDFIVGFPGETDADFAATMALVRQLGYAQAYSFKYSRRPGTPAAAMAEQVAPAVADARLQQLQALLNDQQAAFNAATVAQHAGRAVPVLLERTGRHAGQLVGKTPWLQSVHVDAPGAALGDLIDAALVSAGPNSIAGEIIAG